MDQFEDDPRLNRVFQNPLAIQEGSRLSPHVGNHVIAVTTFDNRSVEQRNVFIVETHLSLRVSSENDLVLQKIA